MRINKLFSNYGICSRKETNKLIEEKRIKVNGKACVLGQWIEENDEIRLDDKPITMKEKVYIAFNKPVGIVCTAENNVSDNIVDFIKYNQYIFPVGRLDKESQGLIIMTNDGDLASAILESDNMHEKEYIVELDKAFNDEFLEKMAKGVEISNRQTSGIKRISDQLGMYKNHNYNNRNTKTDSTDVVLLKEVSNNVISKNNKIKTRPCEISRINSNCFNIILTQGLNKQIRKMCGTLGYKVTKLERIRIMNIKLNDLECGKWRYFNEDELINLKINAYKS